MAILAAGYRCVAWVSNDTETDRRYTHGTERLEGLNAALSGETLAIKSFNIPYSGHPSTTTLSECYIPSTAIVASEYRTATAIAHHAATFGKCPGRDFGLVCCDDSASFLEVWPQLSRASFDRNALGKKAAEMILKRLENPYQPTHSVIDRPEWIEGTTIGRAAHYST
jgi:DNA-binding LacI/PurR family transcriptional regulator